MQSSTPASTNELNRQSPLIIAPFFLWGTAMVVMKALLPQTSPMFMAAVRLLPAGLLLILGGAYFGRNQPKGWQAWLWISLFALVDGTMFQGFLAQGLVRTNAGLGSLLIDSQPLAVAVLASVLYKEKIGIGATLGLLVGVIGIGLIGLPSELMTALLAGDFATILEAGVFTLGEWFMLGASLSMAIGTILIRPVVRYADPVMATGWHMVIGGLPLLLISNQIEQNQWQAVTSWGWLGMAYMAIMGSAIAYGLFFFFASSGSLTTLSALTFSTPVFALMFSSLFLGENLTLVQWIGVILTLTSIYLVSVRGSESVSSEVNSESETMTEAKILTAAEQVAVSSAVPILQQPVNESLINERQFDERGKW
ncbi:DMT family transporter [Pseudanabaena sp. Chao 1811]|uniref:DMT family transporter n=1 Tax=Pseudanabaena sp. Chao 1811 TaxID=2963092 RepID=UPI0022F3FCD5|nr:DMT family transporter [Pseudanabaena sp. Chao 1811]